MNPKLLLSVLVLGLLFAVSFAEQDDDDDDDGSDGDGDDDDNDDDNDDDDDEDDNDNDEKPRSVSTDSPPVHLTVYYECLCPDSQDFITKQLWPTYQRVPDIMKLELIPYGFAKEIILSNSTYSYKCHHGKNECHGNLIQTCAINLLNDVSKSLPFIACMESKWSSHKYGKECAKKLELDYQHIFNCAQSQGGKKWQHEMANKTKSLVPSLNYVPWIVIDGKSGKRIQDEAAVNLLALVCRSYKGKKPNSCPNNSQEAEL